MTDYQTTAPWAKLACDPYPAAAASAARLARLTGMAAHDVAVILGSGWAQASDALGAAVAEISLAELGGFPEQTVGGHQGSVRSMVLTAAATGPTRLLVFLGRSHLYEGHSPATVVHGVRTAIAAGCRGIVLTNAAGGIRDGFRVGQPVIIRDHLNLTRSSPPARPPPPEGHPSP